MTSGKNKAKLIARKAIFFLLTIFWFISHTSAVSFSQTATKLQILLPGMTAAPGTTNGYTGVAEDQKVGVPFDIIVNAVDGNWNVVNVSDQVSITSSDLYANLPLPTFLDDGTVTLTITLNSNGTHAISAHDDTNPSVLGVTSPSIEVINLSHFTVSTIGDPWWIIPGKVTVGDDIQRVEIIAYDTNGERAYGYNGVVNLMELTDYGSGRISPETITMEAGKWKGTIRIYRAGKKQANWGVTGDVWVRAYDNTIQGESNRFCAMPRSVNRLLTIVPGENHLPGSISGKTGAPIDQQSNADFTINVYATDQYWNQIESVYHTIALSSSDAAAVLPPSNEMNKGKISMTVKLKTSGQQTITARDVSYPNITSSTSSPITVISHGLHHFVISHISSPRVAGENFPAIITAVDENDNLVGDFNGTLDLNVTTGNQTISPNLIQMTNGWWSGDIMVTKAASLVMLSVQDRTSPPHTGQSNQFDVNAGPTAKLQVLLPGEVSTPGISPGKSGSASEILSGTGINVRVNAVDAWWNVTTGNTDIIRLASSDQAANLPTDAALAAGTRQFVVTLNTTGLQTISAFDQTAPEIAHGVSSQIRVNPGNMDHFVFNNISGPQTAGVPFYVTIIAVDQLGNPINAYSGVVNLSASTGDGTIVPITANFNNGTWTGNITLKKASGGVTLTAKDGATPPHSGTSNEFEVNPGPIASFQVLVPGLTATPGISPGYTGTPQAQNVGKPFAISVNGIDAYWNVATSAADSFGVSSTDLSASLPPSTILNNGTRNLSITLNEDGNQTISAYALNNHSIQNGQTPQITVLPQDLDHFAFSQIDGPVVVGQPVQITIHAKTNKNEDVLNFDGEVTLSASTGDGTMSPAVAGPFENGAWTGEIILRKAASEVTVSVTDGATPAHTGTSNAFTVTPGAFKKLQVLLPGETANPGSVSGKKNLPADQQTGAQFDVAVRAVDEFWNLVSQVNDSLSTFSSDSMAILPAKSKLINGLTNLSVIMGSAGTHTITAIDISDSSKLAGISSAFNVNPGNLDHFIFDTITDHVAGNEFMIKITAADPVGNPVAGFNGHVKLQASTGTKTVSPTEMDFVDGVWNGKVTITRAADNVKLTCLDFAATPHTGESNSFKITPGDFSRLQVILAGETSTPGIAPGKTGNVETQIVGEVVSITVNAVDSWWNPVPTATGIIGITSTDVTANLPLDKSLQSGSVSFSDMRFGNPGYWTITAQCKSNPQISSETSSLIHVVSGSVTSFAFDPINSPQTAGDTIHVRIRAVDGSGSTVTNYNELANITASTGPGTIYVGEVHFANGEWDGSVVLTKAVQSIHINIHDFADIVRGNSNPFTLLPGAMAKLQIILPGETANPGQEFGKTGSPGAQAVGVPFNIKVNVTDNWWNLVKPDSVRLHFSSSDAIASLPKDTVQSASCVEYKLALLTEGKSTITVSSTNYPLLIDTSSSLQIASGLLDHFVFSLIDSVQIAGHPFIVKIEAYNEHNYPVTDYEGDIILSASTGNGTLSKTGVTIANGFWQGELFVTRADSEVVLYAADYIPAPNTNTGYSNYFKVRADSLAGLQVLLPGESITPGVQPGKKGDTEYQIAGQEVNVTVRAVDSYWNLIPNCNDTLFVSISDSFAVKDDYIALANGLAEFPVTFRAARNHQVLAQLMGNASIEAAISDTLLIKPNVYTQIILLLPGESLLPGDDENDPLNTPGRIGKSLAQTSQLPFNVEVYAVDDYWNLVTNGSPDRIRLYSTDQSTIFSPNDTTLVDGKASFNVTLQQGGNQVLRAINMTNSGIRSSLDAIVEVLVGGLHYEIALDTTEVSAGDNFLMTVYYKNGIGEIVSSANQLVHLTAVDSKELTEIENNIKNTSFNLQSGHRSVNQSFNTVGSYRIKVVDDLGTEPAYSDPIEVNSGKVATMSLEASKNEVRALESTVITTTLKDAVGNPVPNQAVAFSLVSGTGELTQVSATSNENGIVNVEFKGGKVTETNVVRAELDNLSADIEIIVNLTPSSLANGVPLNYPNPFGVESPVTHIEYFLEENADVTLLVYDLFGNLVWKKEIEAGTPGGMGRDNSLHANSVEWNGLNDKGQKAGNGGYILIAKAKANGKVIMNAKRKIAIIR